jgi:hypothetical protein
MIARHQALPALDTFIKLIHSALQDNRITAAKVSITSQKSNPDSSLFRVPARRWHRPFCRCEPQPDRHRWGS